MATFPAVAAVAKAVLQMISENCPRAEFAGSSPKFDVYGPESFSTPMAEGYSIHLLRVTINPSLRNSAPRRDLQGRPMRPSLPVDLQFLLTPWAAEPERQLRLVGWAMRFLEDNPILSASYLNSALTLRDTAVFSGEEAAELVYDPPSLADHLGIWDKFKPKLPPSLYYTARMIRLDSSVSIKEFEPVRTREFQAGSLRTDGGTA